MSNLLEKASIITTPTAYENGKILSVKPEPSLGSELVTNGDFENGSANWSTNDWVIANGIATATNIANSLNQSLSVTLGATYSVSINVLYSDDVLGLRVKIGGVFSDYFQEGLHTLLITTTGTQSLQIVPRSSNSTYSIDSVSVKQLIDADFDFTRNSSATRVNSEGLIEDVQILSSNLVSNGDFSQEGSEEVTNGDFSNGSTDWNSEQGIWTFGDSVVNGNGANGSSEELTQSAVTTVGKNYNITYEVLNYVSGSVQILGSEIGYVSGNGVYTSYYSASSSTLKFRPINFNGSITNVSVKEVGQGWTVSNGTITDKYNASMTAYQTGIRILPFSNTGTFKVTFDLVVTSGSCKFDAGGVNNAIFNTSGTKEIIVTDITKFEFNAFNLGWVGTLDNVSVIEITDDTNLPRIDYTGGTGHWLFEPQSTNLFPYSDVSSGFTKTKVTTSNNQGTSPDGSNNATKMLMTSGTGSHRVYQAIPSSLNDNNTLSVFIKEQSEVSHIGLTAKTAGTIVAWFSGSDGSIINANGLDAKTQSLSNGWHRISISYVSDDTLAADNQFVYFSNRENTSANPAFNGTETVLMYGFQVEKLSYATSYIPTNGSTVTRLQDAAFGAGSSDLINSTEGVLYFEGLFLSDGFKFVSLNSGSATNRVSIYSSSQSTIGYNVRNSNGNQMNGNFVIGSTINHKCALKFKENDFALWIDGVEVVTDNSGTTFSSGTLNELSYNGGAVGSSNFYGKVKALAVFKEALTDDELECLTTI